MDDSERLNIERDVAGFLTFIRVKYGLRVDPILDEAIFDTVVLLLTSTKERS